MNIPAHNRRLHEAIRCGDLSKVMSIVETKVLGPVDLSYGLSEAVVAGHTVIGDYLIRQGADMHYFDKGKPLLVTSVLRRDTEMFYMLLGHCQNINFEYNKGNLAHAAVKVKSLIVLQELEKFHKKFVLYDKADEVNCRTPLHEAVVVLSQRTDTPPQSPHIELDDKKTLFPTKSDKEESLAGSDQGKMKAEHQEKAIYLRSLSKEKELVSFPLESEIVRFFLDRGCDPNTKDRQKKRTPLHDAAAGGKLDIVLLLLSAGALLYQEDSWGSLPWTEAVAAGHEGVASYLLKEEDLYHTFQDHRANCNHAFAAISKSVTCVQYLIKRGVDMADPSLINPNGFTPLIRAIKMCKADSASLLVRFSGPVINERTTTEYTAVDYALEAWQSREERSWGKILNDMVKHGAHLNLKVGINQVHILMQREPLIHPWKLDWILTQRPDLNVKSKEGWYLFQVVIHHLSVLRPSHIGVKVLLKLLNHGMWVPKQFTAVKAKTDSHSGKTIVKSSPVFEALRGRHIVLAYLLHLFGCHSGEKEIYHWYHSDRSAFLRCASEYANELMEYLINVEKQPSRLQDLIRTAILRALPPGNVRTLADRLPLPIELRRRLEWEHEIDSKPKALPHFYRVIKEMLDWPECKEDSPEWEGFLFAPELTFEY